MTLTFETLTSPGTGHLPQGAHMNDNTLRILYIDDADGMLHAYDTTPTAGQYSGLTWTASDPLSPDLAISCPRIKRVAHYGIYGYWSDGDDHRFVMYMFPTDISRQFLDGKVTRTVGSKVVSVSATFHNIAGQLVNKRRAVLAPCARIEFWFSMGDSEEFSLGAFYIDSASVTYPDGSVSMRGRNAIGRLLKEQQFCEDNRFTSGSLVQNLTDILVLMGVKEYFVDVVNVDWDLIFDRDLSALDGIENVLALLPGYIIDENAEGVIGIAMPDDERFDAPKGLGMVREMNCWSYDVQYDDAQAAAQVCIVSSDEDESDNPLFTVYQPVTRNQYWAQPSHRTNFYKAPKGTTEEQAQKMAKSLADALSLSGRVESFVGLFAPQITIGDEIEIYESLDQIGNADMIGTVTDVCHNFGRKGFFSSFTVDSGGRKGKDRLSDLIAKMQNKKSQGVTIQ